MANTGRSTYEPPDDIHVFDGAEDDDDVEGSRLPLLIVIALLVLATFAGVVWLAYTQGVARGRSDVPRMIAAQPGPAKVAPARSRAMPPPHRSRASRSISSRRRPMTRQTVRSRRRRLVRISRRLPAPDTTPVTPAQDRAGPSPKTATASGQGAAALGRKVARRRRAPAHIRDAGTSACRPSRWPRLSPRRQPVKTHRPRPGAYVLQIGAYKSEADAAAAWHTYHGQARGPACRAIRRTSSRSIWAKREHGTGCVSARSRTRTRRKRCARS